MTWLVAMFAQHITQGWEKASRTALGSLAEHILECSSAHFSPPILQLHCDNPKTTARTYSTIHHCQTVGHNPLVRNCSPFHTNTHNWEQHKQRTRVVKLRCLRVRDLQTMVQKGAEERCRFLYFHSGQKGKFLSPHHNKNTLARPASKSLDHILPAETIDYWASHAFMCN